MPMALMRSIQAESPLREREITSTPSYMAASKPAMTSESSKMSPWPTLYAATLAPGAPPLAVPFMTPKRLTLGTKLPPAVESVCVPWPSKSRGLLNSSPE
ncbi:unnamed protein product [Spirodela intermedia]|uniref:Uncharacterized protein n=1 Tax=Spirodela intermedia TaxID=51605 RepID=A0A7I8KB79_SPIIN|nr:unnamed protein product [Spirodela intermedia]